MRLPLLLLVASLTASETAAAPGARAYPLAGFDQVSLSGSDRLIVHAGQRFSVRAVGEPVDLDRMTMAVRDGELRIGRQPGMVRNARGVTVTVTLPRLDGLSVKGSGSAAADAIQGGDVNLALSGSGGITAKGAARRVSMAVNGSGGIDTRALEARTIDAAVSGSGAIRGLARGSAAIAVRGSGTVRIAGTTRCQIATSGSGTARCG